MSAEVAVIRFPGTNGDRDCMKALKIIGADPRIVWHEDCDLSTASAVVVPGGFSYGDYLWPGRIARASHVMNRLRDFAASGRPVLGICNGFQILVEAGLLQGAFLRNATRRFVCRSVELGVAQSDLFTRGVAAEINLPVAHGYGCYFLPPREHQLALDEGRILFTYQQDGFDNGSTGRIAGILGEKRNVLGMMPHPERAVDSRLSGGAAGREIFESMIGGRR